MNHCNLFFGFARCKSFITEEGSLTVFAAVP